MTDRLAVIAAALDDGHGTPENEMDAARAVINALWEAGFDVVEREVDVRTDLL